MSLEEIAQSPICTDCFSRTDNAVGVEDPSGPSRVSLSNGSSLKLERPSDQSDTPDADDLGLEAVPKNTIDDRLVTSLNDSRATLQHQPTSPLTTMTISFNDTAENSNSADDAEIHKIRDFSKSDEETFSMESSQKSPRAAAAHGARADPQPTMSFTPRLAQGSRSFSHESFRDETPRPPRVVREPQPPSVFPSSEAACAAAKDAELVPSQRVVSLDAWTDAISGAYTLLLDLNATWDQTCAGRFGKGVLTASFARECLAALKELTFQTHSAVMAFEGIFGRPFVYDATPGAPGEEGRGELCLISVRPALEKAFLEMLGSPAWVKERIDAEVASGIVTSSPGGPAGVTAGALGTLKALVKDAVRVAARLQQFTDAEVLNNTRLGRAQPEPVRAVTPPGDARESSRFSRTHGSLQRPNQYKKGAASVVRAPREKPSATLVGNPAMKSSMVFELGERTGFPPSSQVDTSGIRDETHPRHDGYIDSLLTPPDLIPPFPSVSVAFHSAEAAKLTRQSGLAPLKKSGKRSFKNSPRLTGSLGERLLGQTVHNRRLKEEAMAFERPQETAFEPRAQASRRQSRQQKPRIPPLANRFYNRTEAVSKGSRGGPRSQRQQESYANTLNFLSTVKVVPVQEGAPGPTGARLGHTSPNQAHFRFKNVPKLRAETLLSTDGKGLSPNELLHSPIGLAGSTFVPKRPRKPASASAGRRVGRAPDLQFLHVVPQTERGAGKKNLLGFRMDFDDPVLWESPRAREVATSPQQTQTHARLRSSKDIDILSCVSKELEKTRRLEEITRKIRSPVPADTGAGLFCFGDSQTHQKDSPVGSDRPNETPHMTRCTCSGRNGFGNVPSPSDS
eukprot:gnl/Chilomastix_cuspidata/3751.p1 GENE.gnl/Chilomastix_cuspidata/3751~~gnl/Chilomastix_cuspidata/3751.p1  ORF type:complete len:851 (+),score=144.05 gnl/Chilomastix_cuspidata/3751:28-2580(+)